MVRRPVAWIVAIVLFVEGLGVAALQWFMGVVVDRQDMSLAGLDPDVMSTSSKAGGIVFGLYFVFCGVVALLVALRNRPPAGLGRVALISVAVVHGLLGAVAWGLLGVPQFVFMIVMLALIVLLLMTYDGEGAAGRPTPAQGPGGPAEGTAADGGPAAPGEAPAAPGEGTAGAGGPAAQSASGKVPPQRTQEADAGETGTPVATAQDTPATDAPAKVGFTKDTPADGAPAVEHASAKAGLTKDTKDTSAEDTTLVTATGAQDGPAAHSDPAVEPAPAKDAPAKGAPSKDIGPVVVSAPPGSTTP